MNDFTREELEEIIESFDWIETETWWDWKHPLRKKILNMINNYCEHPVLEGGVIGFKCMGCNGMVYDNQ